MSEPGKVQVDAQALALEGVAASIYRRVYHVLVIGMVLSTSLFAAGLLRAWAQHQSVPLSTSWIREQYNWDTFIAGLAHFEATSLLMAATFVLILTPVIRVVVSIFAFAVEGDRKFTAITATVLAIILCTVALAHAGLVSPEHVAVKDSTARDEKVARNPTP